LIDEYDKLILVDHMDGIELAENNRKVLKGFYGILKSIGKRFESFWYASGTPAFLSGS